MALCTVEDAETMADDKAYADTPHRTGFTIACARGAVLKRAKAVLLVPLVAAFAAFLVLTLMPERYTASALIQIGPRQMPAAADDPDALPAPATFEAERQSIEKEIAALQSASLMERVIAELKLDDDPEFKKQPLSAVILSPFAKTDSQAIAREVFRSGLAVQRLHNSSLIAVRYSSPDAAKAQQIANTIASIYVAGENPALAASDATKLSQSEPTASERAFSAMLAEYGYARTLSRAQVIQKAQMPSEPAGAKKLRVAAITAISSLAIMLALAVLLERNALLRTRKVEKTLACPHMTTLPAMTSDGDEDVTASARSARLIVAEPACPYADAVRDACSELAKRTDGESTRVILVASALPGEGAEAFASNMAHHLAVAGEKTLLVDCDFRSKGLTRQLSPHATAGLLDQIANHAPVEKVILRDSLTGVHFLPASGPAPVSLAVPAALRSLGFTASFQSLKARFSTIVLAAPPLLDTTDARALAELADQIVFLTAWHRTPHAVAKKALAVLDAHQHKVAGAVLTDISDESDASLMSFGAIFREIRRATRLVSFDRAA